MESKHEREIRRGKEWIQNQFESLGVGAMWDLHRISDGELLYLLHENSIVDHVWFSTEAVSDCADGDNWRRFMCQWIRWRAKAGKNNPAPRNNWHRCHIEIPKSSLGNA